DVAHRARLLRPFPGDSRFLRDAFEPDAGGGISDRRDRRNRTWGRAAAAERNGEGKKRPQTAKSKSLAGLGMSYWWLDWRGCGVQQADTVIRSARPQVSGRAVG